MAAPPRTDAWSGKSGSKPLVNGLHGWLMTQLERVSSKSALAEAARYALRHWTGLVLFLEDGRLELDTNTIERAIRPNAITRSFCPYRAGGRGPLSLACPLWSPRPVPA